MHNFQENAKLTVNTKTHASSAKRLDVLEGIFTLKSGSQTHNQKLDQVQDGKLHHYVKDQYQNQRKTAAAQGIKYFSQFAKQFIFYR